MRRCLLLLCTLLLVGLTANTAEARRRGIAIPIPSFSKGEALVFVKELPKGLPFLTKDGKQIDLGYHWDAKDNGKWVGYVTDTRYLQWSPKMLDAIVLLSGMKSLPPVPERPLSLSGIGGWGGAFWVVIIGLIAIAVLFKKKLGGSSQEAPAPVAAMPVPSTGDDWMKRAEMAIKRPTPATAQSVARAAPMARRSRMVAAPAAPRAAFGRRQG